jgi:mannose/fructose-specific phosphotransferase system component IIA
VGIVIVTHGQTGQSLVNDAEFILGQSLGRIRCIEFNQSGGQAIGNAELKQLIAQSDRGAGVLVLTDLVGASPANLVTGLLGEFQATMVTGINLAMLIRVWNYRDTPLESLTRKAVQGGKRGVEAFSQQIE